MHDPRLDDEFTVEMRRALEDVAERARSRTGLTIVARLLEGPIGKALHDCAAERGADLIVMTTHGYGGISRAWLGSVADYLVRHANVPVLLVRPGAEGADAGREPLFRHILVPLDGSTTAESALDNAVMVGAPGETEYTLLHVVVPSVSGGHPSAGQNPRQDRAIDRLAVERREREARVYLDRLRKELEESGCIAKVEVITHWQIARGILEHARSSGSDLIALTTHGRGGSVSAVLGSVGDKLLRGAKTPVLLYHPPQSAADPGERAAETAELVS